MLVKLFELSRDRAERRINGAVTAKWTDCQVPRGYVGLEAEGWDIEFRNVKFKAEGK